LSMCHCIKSQWDKVIHGYVETISTQDWLLCLVAEGLLYYLFF